MSLGCAHLSELIIQLCPNSLKISSVEDAIPIKVPEAAVKSFAGLSSFTPNKPTPDSPWGTVTEGSQTSGRKDNLCKKETQT